MAARLADRLTDARQRGFFGRGAELSAFDDMLVGGAVPLVLYVEGPGGVGKTTLLRQYADRSRTAGRPVVWLDGREVGLAAQPAAVLADALADGTGPDDAAAAFERLDHAVLIIDTAEALAGRQRWIYDELLPRLGTGGAVVIASREAPPARWRTDPGWRDLLRHLRLDNLADAEALELLRWRGVPESAHAAAMTFTHGHPLALALLGDVCAQEGGPPVPAQTQEVVSTLVRELVGAVPSGQHRAALEAAAQVRVVTEPMLAALLDLGDAHEEFGWLRGLSIMDYSARGLFPHELAREVLAAELRWRHPAQHAEVRQRARTYYRDRFAAAGAAAQQAILTDYAFLHRHSPGLTAMLSQLGPDGADGGGLTLAVARADELPLLTELVRRHEGPVSAQIFAHWAGLQPGAVQVARDAAGQPAGLQLLLTLADTTADQRAPDPMAAAAWDQLQQAGPLTDGGRATVVRFWLDAADYQDISPLQTMLALQLVRYYLTTPRLEYHFFVCADPDRWAPVCAYADLHRLPALDIQLGERAFGAYGHDWRAVPPLAWLALLADREDAEEVSTAPPPTPATLDESAFAEAVRAALRDLDRPDRLTASPLVSAAAVQVGSGAEPGRAVVAFVQAGAKQMADSVRDRSAYRALHHTYLQPAETQRAAADLLDLPMSTYRRHLAAGITRLTAILWRIETRARAGTP